MTGDTVKDRIRLLRDLRAVRRFSARSVPRQAVIDLLEVARWTGSGRNRQPWELILIRDRRTLRALGSVGGSPGIQHLADAALAVVLVPTSQSTEFDEGRLAERIMLAAAAHGLGSSIAGFRGAESVEAAKRILGIPVKPTLRTAISIGYPAEVSARLVSVERAVDPRLPLGNLTVGRKPLTEIVHYERYGLRAQL